MSGPFKRRPSLKVLPNICLKSTDLQRRQSVAKVKSINTGQQEVSWDIVDRCLLPVIFCHAASVIVSNVINILQISQISTLTLFIFFTITTIAALLIYHSLKVTVVGKCILITGCDLPIGSALARHLDEQGFTVFAGFQNISENSIVEELKECCSGRLHIIQLDVSSETQILAASLYAVEHLPNGSPGLWAVVHAASWPALGEIEWIPSQVIKKATEINWLGPIRVNQIMLPLIRRARGRVIMLTSGLCKVPSAVRGIHCGLLAAIEVQAECLRKELKSRGVDVIVVAPGEFTAGNSWLSNQFIFQQARDMWLQMGNEVKSEYGKDYFETAVRSLETKFTKGQIADLSAVLRSLTDAVVRTFPLSRYTPITYKEKIEAFVAEQFPTSFYDIIYT